mgnify:CR=1 FL=1
MTTMFGDLDQWSTVLHVLAAMGLGAVLANGSGRVQTVIIKHTTPGDGEYPMSAAAFRAVVGPARIRSTLWSDDTPKKRQQPDGSWVWQFTCKGYGHGVGLSQVSAWEMARQGLTAKRILEFFYGTRVQLAQIW